MRASPPETRVELERLAQGYGLVACVTGRASAFAREIVGVEELRYVGEHGLELDPEAADWSERIHAFAAGAAWRDTEPKPLSAAFHYRGVVDERGGARPARGGRGARRSTRASHALGPDGARGPAAARRVEGHRRAAAARRVGPAPRALRGRRHDRPRRLRRARRARCGGARRRRLERRAVCARRPRRRDRRLDRVVPRAAAAVYRPRRSRSCRDWRRATSSSVFAASASWRRKRSGAARFTPATLPRLTR